MVRTVELTAEELLRLNLPSKRTELVRGTLVVREPTGFRHGEVAGNIFAAIALYVRAGNLGVLLAAETGFMLSSGPDTVRAADVAFIRRERVPDPAPLGYAAMAPDLVVEVLSPDDRPGEVREKVADWLQAGSGLVWVVDPVKRRARVYRADGSDETIAVEDELSGESVLPGFTCRLSAVL